MSGRVRIADRIVPGMLVEPGQVLGNMLGCGGSDDDVPTPGTDPVFDDGGRESLTAEVRRVADSTPADDRATMLRV